MFVISSVNVSAQTLKTCTAISQSAIACSKLTIETLEQDMKCIQN